jgi:hypothetical protein
MISIFHLQVAVTNFEMKTVNREDIIFYKIELYSHLTKKEWTVMRRYNDFWELNLILEKYFVKIPAFPGKSLTKVKDISELNRRKEFLENFLKVNHFVIFRI